MRFVNLHNFCMSDFQIKSAIIYLIHSLSALLFDSIDLGVCETPKPLQALVMVLGPYRYQRTQDIYL